MITDEQFAALSARVAKLEGEKPVEPASAVFAARFADDVVRKQPKNWNHAPVEGRKFRDLSPAEAKDLSGYFLWKANKGAEDPNPAKDNKGRPWHERDRMIASVLAYYASRVPASSDDAPF